jgi:hypothetical protein
MNNLSPADRISDRKTAYTAAAKACRYAAVMDWAPTAEGELVTGALDGPNWECCALGAVALQHRVDHHAELPMEDILNEVQGMFLAETLSPVPGIKDRSVASRSVARIFDRMANTYHRARHGLPMDSLDRRVLKENGIADAEDFANLSRSEFWLLAAKRFEQLAN